MKRVGVLPILAIALFVVVGIVLPTHSVLADCTWTKTFDFQVDGASGWEANGIHNPAYIDGGGWHSANTGSIHFIEIGVSFGATVNITSYSINLVNTLTGHDGSSHGAASWQLSGSDVYVKNPINPLRSVANQNFYEAVTFATDGMRLAFDTDVWEFYVTSVVLGGTGTNPWGLGTGCGGGGGGGPAIGGTRTRPLTSADEVDTSPLYDQSTIGNYATTNFQDYQVYPVLSNGDYQSVSAWSDAPGAKVHALDDGSVISVKPLAFDDCGTGFVSPSSLDIEAEQTIIYTGFTADQIQPCLVRRFEITGADGEAYNDIAKDEYYLDPSNGYIVTIQVGSGAKVEYLVRNANQYVVVGDTIVAGCVLGETMPLTALPTPSINFPALSAVASTVGYFTGGALSFIAGGVSTVTGLASVFFPSPVPSSTTMGYMAMAAFDVEDNRIELASALTVEPTNTDNCNASGEYKDCLAFNPQFANNGDGWQASGNVEWTEPGVILDPGESVFTTVNLSSTADYTATAFAQGVDGAASEIRIFLGTHTQRYTAPLEWSSVQLAAEPLGAPDLGTFYSVGVQNTGTAPIAVASLCVTDGAPNVGPNSCYFNNHTFTQGTSGWDVSVGVTPFDDALNVPDNGTISQNVKLYPLPSGPATYNLVVRGNWWYTGSIDEASSAAAVAQIQYEWPSGSGYQNMVPISTTGNLAFGLGSLAFKAEITVSSLTDAVMNIRVNTTDAGTMDVQGITITDACLSTVNGGNFPEQGGGGNVPPIQANCTYVSRPQNNDPAAWLQWHWAKSEQFFKCDLMVLLNKMYTIGKQSYTLAGWQARYWQSSAKLWADWMGKQLFPWFNGQFRNMAIGQVTTVYQSGGQCSDLFCVLNTLINGLITPLQQIVTTVLDLLNKGANLFLTVLTGIIGLALAFIGKIILLFNQLTGLFTGIISAYNTSTPATIEGLPMCSIDPNSSPFCRATWLLDNTILSGRWAVLLIIILGIASIHLILWVVGEFKAAIVNVGSSA